MTLVTHPIGRYAQAVLEELDAQQTPVEAYRLLYVIKSVVRKDVRLREALSELVTRSFIARRTKERYEISGDGRAYLDRQRSRQREQEAKEALGL